jgi:hypothetical protein
MTSTNACSTTQLTTRHLGCDVAAMQGERPARSSHLPAGYCPYVCSRAAAYMPFANRWHALLINYLLGFNLSIDTVLLLRDWSMSKLTGR